MERVGDHRVVGLLDFAGDGRYTQYPIEGESFAPTFTDADAPGKRTQFYSMLGQRAIYHDGWLANTLHPPMSGLGG